MKTILMILIVSISLFIVACNRNGTGDADGMPVTVVKAVQQTVPVDLEYIGQTASVAQVEVRARVEGFLQDLGFSEGEDVKKDQMLFLIDPRPFEAELNVARGQLLESQANAEYFAAEERRMSILLEQHAVSQEQYDQTLAQKKQADAQVEMSRANVVTARLNLSYATMESPIDGRIGEKFVDIGNLVGGDSQTLLATVVQLNPIHILFSPSERDYLQIVEQLTDDKLDVTVSLASDPATRFSGTLDFVDNQVQPGTGTVLIRAEIPNEQEILLPGMYVNVVLHLGEDDHAILVPSIAVAEGQGGEYAYVVGDDNTVSQRSVVARGVYDQADGQQMSVILSGLQLGERVVVTRLTRMVPGLKVLPSEQTIEKTTDDQQQAAAPADDKQ